ncbi:MAG: tetratricopeptide repeat protein [Pirellulales bacterium]|jgi:tetratricopeptide (TPR) repeat protein
MHSRKTQFSLLLLLSLVLFMPTTVQAENEGQADLDKAVDAKLDAESIDDLGKVVELCESALKKGLSEDDQQFAKQLVTSVLYQRATQYSRGIFDQSPPNPEWKNLRKLSLKEIEKALAISEELGDLHFLRARLLLLPEGDRKQAQKSLKKSIQLLEDSPEQLSKAILLSSSFEEDVDKQIQLIEQAIELDPDNINALRLRGLIALQAEDFNKAIEALEKVVEKTPNDVTALQAYAQAFAKLGKFDEAIAQLDRSIELNPKSPVAYLLRAQLKGVSNDIQGAIKDIDQVIALSPKALTALMMRAQWYRDLKRPEDAEKDYDRILEIEPTNLQAQVFRNLVLDSQGKFNQVLAELKTFLEKSPDQSDTILVNAQLFHSRNQSKKSIQIYTLLVEAEPGNWKAHYGRSDTYLALGKHKEAIAGYAAALKLKKGESNLLNNYAWVLATSPDKDVRDGVKAVELAKKACEVTDYKAPHILSTLAAAHAEAGNFDKAKEWATKAVDLVEDGDENADQLSKELKSYQQEKPWRESKLEELMDQGDVEVKEDNEI